MNTKHPSLSALAIGLIASAATLFSSPLRAAPGDLDTTFGSGGKVTTSINSGAYNIEEFLDVVVLEDGKILAVGHTESGSSNTDFALARYLSDGTLDTTFGAGGTRLVDYGTTSDFGRSLAVQSDGKIIVAGNAQNDIAVARFTADGALDTSFDNDGMVVADFIPATQKGYSVAVQSDGKIVVAGALQGIGGDGFVVVRFLSDGTPDTSFDGDGYSFTDVGDFEVVSGMALQEDGKIVVVGAARNATDFDMAVVRYRTDGSTDPSFGNAGIVTTTIGTENEFAFDVAIQTDGKIVTVGRATIGVGLAKSDDFAVVRYQANGNLDTNFGSNGSVTTDFSGQTDDARAVFLQTDGGIVAAGSVYGTTTGNDIGLARYTAAGVLDTMFGTGGKVTTDFAGQSGDDGHGVDLQSDGKIIVAGRAETAMTSYDFALARYENTLLRVQPDNILSGRGNNIYNSTGAGQTQKLVSRKARTVRTNLTIENDGDSAESFLLRGTGKNRYFKVIYQSGTNITGAVTAGTFATHTLNPGERTTVTVTVKPVRSKLLKKTKKKKVWRAKSRTFILTSRSPINLAKSDTAKATVQHKR